MTVNSTKKSMIHMEDAEDTQTQSGKQKQNGVVNLNPIMLEKKTRLKNVPISQIIPYKNNPKKNNQVSVSALAKSIDRLGYLKTSITVDENYVILTGHTTIKALKQLGWSEVPEVDLISGLTEDEKTLYRINDNQLSYLDEWDKSLLDEQLNSLDEELKLLSGFDEPLVEEPESDGGSEDELPEEKECKVIFGDIYRLGRHYLVCGDCTLKDTYSKVKEPTLILTDPPYGIKAVKKSKVGGGGATKFGGVAGKYIESSTFKDIKNDESTDVAKSFIGLFPKTPTIIFGGNYFTDFLSPSKCWIVWDKENTGKFADVELAWCSHDKGAKLYKWLWNGLSRKGERAEELKKRVHPTQKPVGLMKKILNDFSTESDIVLDAFAGSGSILIACEATGRTCISIELDPEYCQQIIDRYEQFTGEEACKLT